MSWSPDRYARALRFAAERHATQCYPGTELPYLLHVVSVAAEIQRALVEEPVADPDTAVTCALLHDTVEDTHTTVEEIADAFGPGIAAGVHALTKDPTLAKAEQMPDSLRRIRQQPTEVWMVKLADRISNLAAPPHYWPNGKRLAYRAEGELIAAELGAASTWLGNRLRCRIEAYAAYLD